jgi:hypothetical protein
VRAEIEANQKMVAAGRTLLAINRALVPDVDALDLFSLIDLVSADVTLASDLAALGLPADVSRALLALPEPAADAASVRVDFRGGGVHWLNDIEKDAQYRMWRSSLQEILMPTYPGQLRQIRRNLFSAVFVLDPASPEALRVSKTGFACLSHAWFSVPDCGAFVDLLIEVQVCRVFPLFCLCLCLMLMHRGKLWSILRNECSEVSVFDPASPKEFPPLLLFNFILLGSLTFV